MSHSSIHIGVASKLDGAIPSTELTTIGSIHSTEKATGRGHCRFDIVADRSRNESGGATEAYRRRGTVCLRALGSFIVCE